MKCPMCSDGYSKVYGVWPDFAIQRCQACGFRYIDVTHPDYPEDAQYRYDEAAIGPIRPSLPHIQRRVRDILRFRSPPGRTLDIGCGKGEVALALQQAGFVSTGIDMKSRIMAHMQLHYTAVEWRDMTTTELATLPECYDVITLYHVLEHVADPRAVLTSVKALANPGALIVIEVPNIGGWRAHLRGNDWDYYKIDHVNYFRASDLHRMAMQLGFDVLATRGYHHLSYPQGVFWKDAVKGMLGMIGFQDVVSVFLRKN